MKLGPRKPSIKRSISARTTGRITRNAKKTLNPTYGKTWANNPRKAMYNKIYNKSTYSFWDAIRDDEDVEASCIACGCISFIILVLIIILFCLII
nr:hypothetical protein [Ligilactobacillus equi]